MYWGEKICFIVVDSYCIIIHTVKRNNQHHMGMMMYILHWQRTTCGYGLQVEDSQLAGVWHRTERWRSRMVSRPAVPQHSGLRHLSAPEGSRAGTFKYFYFDCILLYQVTLIHETGIIINPKWWRLIKIIKLQKRQREIYTRDTNVP